MTDIEEFTKSIEEMGIETLRRYALSLQERAQLREAHAAAMLREQDEKTIKRLMREVIQEQQSAQPTLTDFVDSALSAIGQALATFKSEYKAKKKG